MSDAHKRHEHNSPAPGAMPRRATERIVSTLFKIATRTTSLRPSMIPQHMRRELLMIGITDTDLIRVLGNVRRLKDWPYAWEAEGDRKVAAGDAFGAAASYYIAQKLLLTGSPLKNRLYRLVLNQYANMNERYPIERLTIAADQETVAAVVQFPDDASHANPVPLILIVPGVTAAKEEFYPVAQPFVRRGYAVARMDCPGYGETTGILQPGSEHYAALMIEHIAKDPRVIASRTHLMGFSLGGFFALHSARIANVASVVTVSAPFNPAPYLAKLPSMILMALGHMTGSISFDTLLEASKDLSLARVTPLVTVPVKAFHGGRDRTIPHYEARNITDSVAGLSSRTIYPEAHHNCLESFGEMAAEMLAWFDDPFAVVAADAARDRAPENVAAVFDEQAHPHRNIDVPSMPVFDDGFAEGGAV